LRNGSPIRVIVGEDQALFREGVVHALGMSGFDVVAAAADARDLVHKARVHSPDVAVVDVRMPPNHDDDGLIAAREIRKLDPPVAVLVLTQFLDEHYALDVLGDRPEGVGYLLKDRVVDLDAFAEAVRGVARGGSVIDSQVVGRLVGLRRRRPNPLDELTSREREVLKLMAEGKSNKGIADTLFVTVAAVERHVTGIFSKLALSQDSRSEHRRVLAVLRYLQRDHALLGR
jgi:DNA-binding NarL/FixJ family response regulator